MSNLPPYSTFRTDSRQMMFPQATSHGNILTFTPPGFKHSLNVKFPDSRLPVCEKCKRNFKTRDMCRVRNAHTSAPWQTAFLCITLDESCTDKNGKYVDKPLTVRMVQWQPYCVKTPFDPKTPVCAACKRTNRTRSFCRERHKHRALPWCTVYVLLSSLDNADPNTVVAAPSEIVSGEDGAASTTGGNSTPTKSGEGMAAGGGVKEEHADVKRDSQTATPVHAAESFDSAHTTVPTSDESDKKKKSGRDNDEEGDDINDIADSRTFLAKVSGSSTTIHWLELSDYDASDTASFPPAFVSTEGTTMAAMHPPAVQGNMDPNQAQYYAYAAQQQQYALQSQQRHYFQMHQRGQHPYGAQQPGWQPHYQGQPVPMHVAPGHSPTPPHQPPPPPPPQQQQQYPGAMPPQEQPGQPHQPVQPAPAGRAGDTPASPPVTAGEAAAQRRRKKQAAQSAATSRHNASSASSTPAGSTATDGQQQQHQNQHQQHYHHQQQQQLPHPSTPQPQHHYHHPQQWAMYQPQQMYQQPRVPPPHVHPYHPGSIPPPPVGGQPPPGAPAPSDAPPVQYAHPGQQQQEEHQQRQSPHHQHDQSSPPPQQHEYQQQQHLSPGNQHGGEEESAAKRQRLE